jgi:hypothetical protein
MSLSSVRKLIVVPENELLQYVKKDEPTEHQTAAEIPTDTKMKATNEIVMKRLLDGFGDLSDEMRAQFFEELMLRRRELAKSADLTTRQASPPRKGPTKEELQPEPKLDPGQKFPKNKRGKASKMMHALGTSTNDYDNVQALVTHALTPKRRRGRNPKGWNKFKGLLKNTGVEVPYMKNVPRRRAGTMKAKLPSKMGAWLKY